MWEELQMGHDEKSSSESLDKVVDSAVVSCTAQKSFLQLVFQC